MQAPRVLSAQREKSFNKRTGVLSGAPATAFTLTYASTYPTLPSTLYLDVGHSVWITHCILWIS
jgi:hypothetical protein